MNLDSFFEDNAEQKIISPLADKLRPTKLDDFFGQEKILNERSILRNAILQDKVGNTIFSGPPGIGKTTLVEIISLHTRSALIKLNAVFSGIKELRNEISCAESRWKSSKRKTIIFIDEVHRFTSAQQDALLPSVENGTITFIGATTENPYFAINKALLSRSRIFHLKPLGESELRNIIHKVESFYKALDPSINLEIQEEAIKHLIKFSGGDARNLINALELAVNAKSEKKDGILVIDLQTAEDAMQNKKIIYDKNGQNHFDVVSAFIKSIRGSDPDATLFWLANMLEAGEDPNYIFRRLLISASEDIGLADPNAIVVVNSCCDAFERTGMPEGVYFLSQASLYLSLTDKSNSTKSIFRAKESINTLNHFEVPNHLRNNSHLYKNPHLYKDKLFDQKYLPENLKDLKLWAPNQSGWEKIKFEELKKRKFVK